MFIGVVLVLTGTVAVAEVSPEIEAELAADTAFRADAPPPVTEWAASPPLGFPEGRAILFFSDFEADNGGGVGTIDWEWGTYAYAGTCGTQYPPAAPYSGVNMWGTVLNDCYSNLSNNTGYSSSGDCNNTAPADDSILSFTVDLTGVMNAYLYWWEWYDVYSYWDWADVWVDGNVVFEHCESSYTIPTEWVQQEIDISAFAGSVVTIEFHMMSSGVVERSGWYIDDLMVTDTPIPVELRSFTIE